VQDLPGTIPPGAEYDLKVEFHVGAAGEFQTEFTLFTDSPGQLAIPLTIKGTATEQAAKAAP
jgi:hypothetical protein